MSWPLSFSIMLEHLPVIQGTLSSCPSLINCLYFRRPAIEQSLLSNKNNNLATSGPRRRLPWFALVPIALLQLTIAVHQFDHVADYIEGACDVCVQLDRVDAAVDNSAAASPLPTTDFRKSVAPVISVPRVLVRNFDSRAPPQI